MYLFFAIFSYPPYMYYLREPFRASDIYIVTVFICLFLWNNEKKYDNIHLFMKAPNAHESLKNMTPTGLKRTL